MPDAALSLGIAIAAGAAIGFVGGLFAVGGALIAIPVLTLATHMSQHTAQGTAMVMAISGAAATLESYWRRGWIRLSDGWAMALCCWLTTSATAHLVAYIPDRSLAIAFGIFLIFLGLYELIKRPEQERTASTVGLVVQVPVGLVAGVLSGFFVVGGALVTVPLLRAITGMDQRRSQGLALLALVPASIVGVFQYSVAGNVNWKLGVALAIGATMFASAGAAVAARLPQQSLGRGFAIVQVLAGIALTL
jgi:uncharacterized protein